MNRQLNVFACPCQHVHQCVNGEFNGLLIDYIGNTRTCHAEDFRSFSLLELLRFNPSLP
jgi:hypothetical protein